MRASLIALAFVLATCSVLATEYHVAIDGSDGNAGSASQPFKTISAAAQVAHPGDIVTVHKGVYRERVNPARGGSSENQRIVYRAAPGEDVVLKGSEIVKGWVRVKGDTWKVTRPNSFFGDYNPYKDVIGGEWYKQRGFPRHTGTVYLNGTWMDEAPNRMRVLGPTPARPLWYGEINEETTIWAQFKGVDPNEETVEINVRQSVFYPDQPGRNFITVRGFTMRHAATPWAGAMSEQIGLLGTHWSKGWIIEDNVISHSVCTGITLGLPASKEPMPKADAAGYVEYIRMALRNGWSRETIGSHTVRNNHISHCEKNGIHGSLGGIFSVITGNTIHDIGTRGWLDGADLAGLKLLASTDSFIANNHIYRCRGPAKASVKGIWLDWMAQGARVTGNLLHDNERDLYVEVSHGPTLVDNNLLLSENALKDWAQGLAVVHNLIAGQVEYRTVEKRRTPWFSAHSLKDMKLANILLKDARFYNNLLGAEDPLAPYRASGQLEAAGNAPFDRKDISLEKRQDGWWLSFRPDPAWADITRPLVTTELLGKARITGQPFLQPDGSPYRIDRDYFGRKRPDANPAPGPFRIPGNEKVSFKVWPRK